MIKLILLTFLLAGCNMVKPEPEDRFTDAMISAALSCYSGSEYRMSTGAITSIYFRCGNDS